MLTSCLGQVKKYTIQKLTKRTIGKISRVFEIKNSKYRPDYFFLLISRYSHSNNLLKVIFLTHSIPMRMRVGRKLRGGSFFVCTVEVVGRWICEVTASLSSQCGVPYNYLYH